MFCWPGLALLRRTFPLTAFPCGSVDGDIIADFTILDVVVVLEVRPGDEGLGLSSELNESLFKIGLELAGLFFP